jgi:oxygen-independent coproporphyrinogen III oxidase
MTHGGGIYVHLPYCASRCGYCAFVVTTDGASRARYLEALEAEASLVSSEAAGTVFDSIYLGGGTPSLLPPELIERLLSVLRSRFAVDPRAEVTLEANPEDVTEETARDWSRSGINRVSVGVQSLEDVELSAVGRRHDSERALAALRVLARLDFSISGDLILGLPGQTPESFRRSLARLCDAGIGHVSVYLLETDKTKAMQEDRTSHPERYLSDDVQADLWLDLGETLAARGLEHYEISNWARAGRRALHNVKYWTRAPTLGLGVSAHELWAGRRRANVSHLEHYMRELRNGRRPLALDHPVGDEEAARERIFLGLRLREGVLESSIQDLAGRSEDPRLASDYESWLDVGVLERDADRVRFTERGFLVSNEVLSRFV